MHISEKFRKTERLCSKKEMDALFQDGDSFFIYPFRVLWKETDRANPFPAQMAVTVPKKRCKHAVTRNLIKRRTREAYRRQKARLYSELLGSNINIRFMLVYTANEPLPYAVIFDKISAVINRFHKQVREIQ